MTQNYSRRTNLEIYGMNKKKDSGKNMTTPFHHNVPSWMIRYLAHCKCTKCNKPIGKNDIKAIGIRSHKEKILTYIELQCPNCKHSSMRTFGSQAKGTMEEVCLMLLESLQNKKSVKQAQEKESRSQTNELMSDDEIKTFINNMNTFKTFDQLLEEIGATDWLESDTDED